MTVPEINAMFDLIGSALFDKRKLRLKATDPIAGFILEQHEQAILDFIERSFDVDLKDEGLRGVSLYEVIVGYGEGRGDMDLLAEHIFKDTDSDYYMILANDKDYYVNFFKDMKFN